jgi:hypothetical protein
MNKRKLKLIVGIAGTLGVEILLCFGILHYSSLRLSLPAWYMVLFGPSLIGIFASFSPYIHGDPETKGTFEGIPEISDDEIFEKTRRDKAETTETPAIPEVIPPERAIVPVVNIDVNDKDALRKALLAKVLMEINRTEVQIDIDTNLTLDGEFKDPDIKIGFHTPPKKEEKKQAPASDLPKKTEEKNEQLHRARV